GVNPVLMSILEKLYYNQLIHHIGNTHILTDCQFGARQNHSTADALIAMLDIVKTKLNDNKYVILTSVDIQNAFPSVHREKLLEKLYYKYHISDHWIRDYFLNREHYVTLNGSNSNLTQ